MFYFQYIREAYLFKSSPIALGVTCGFTRRSTHSPRDRYAIRYWISARSINCAPIALACFRVKLCVAT